MSETVIPGDAELEIPQGGTVDETWDVTDPPAVEGGAETPSDLTGCEATMRIAKDNATAAKITLRSHDDSHVAITTGSRIVVGASSLRFIITDEDTAGLTETDFVRSGSHRDGFEYRGRNTLLLTRADGETVDVLNNGDVPFYPTVEPAP